MAQAKNDHIPISEPMGIPDIFATELARVEVIGPCVRLTFMVPQTTTFNGSKERAVVARLVLPAEMVRQLPIDLPALMGGHEAMPAPEVRAGLN